MSKEHQIRAAYDDEGIVVYQAYRPSTAQAALEHGTFNTGFKFDRMTWIKPSFGWMLYRAGYAVKPGQKMILKITLTHAGFLDALRQGVLSHYEPSVYESRGAWQAAVKQSDVRIQWDPDRSLALEKLDRRAIQIGLSGATVPAYVHDWIIRLENVTPLAHAIHAAVRQGDPLPEVPEERVYPVDEDIRRRLGMESA